MVKFPNLTLQTTKGKARFVSSMIEKEEIELFFCNEQKYEQSEYGLGDELHFSGSESWSLLFRWYQWFEGEKIFCGDKKRLAHPSRNKDHEIIKIAMYGELFEKNREMIEPWLMVMGEKKGFRFEPMEYAPKLIRDSYLFL